MFGWLKFIVPCRIPKWQRQRNSNAHFLVLETTLTSYERWKLPFNVIEALVPVLNGLIRSKVPRILSLLCVFTNATPRVVHCHVSNYSQPGWTLRHLATSPCFWWIRKWKSVLPDWFPDRAIVRHDWVSCAGNLERWRCEWLKSFECHPLTLLICREMNEGEAAKTFIERTY